MRGPFLTAILSTGAFIALWWLAVLLLELPAYLLPAPHVVLDRVVFLATNADLLSHLAVSTSELVFGFALGSVVGALRSASFGHMPPADTQPVPLTVANLTVAHVLLAHVRWEWVGVSLGYALVLYRPYDSRLFD